MSQEAYPDNNPKTAIGSKKVPLHLVPPVANHFLALAFEDGARKYGPYNWRDKKVSSSVYVGAAKRHLDAWWDGEELSSDAQVHHLAHAMACLTILLDAMTVNKLNDDRPTPGAASELQSTYADQKKLAQENDNKHTNTSNILPAIHRDLEVRPLERRSESTRNVGRDSRPVC